MKDKLIFLDTNILVYAFDISEKEKHHNATKMFKRCLQGKQKYAISLQTLTEFYTIVTKKITKPLDKKMATTLVQWFLKFAGFVKHTPDTETIVRAMELHNKHGSSYWDAQLAAIMLQYNVNTIYTENVKDFKNFPGIRTVNPFMIKKTND
jgi:predicted nucleic acid-binding protein